MDGFIACFEGLEDPRSGNAGRHDLLEILMIALCTVLCGGQSAMAEFAEDKEAFLRSFLTLEHGPPSHDTFSRVLRRLDPDQFRACFQRFMARFAEAAQSVVDGCAAPSIPPAASRRCIWSHRLGLRSAPRPGANRHRREIQ